MTDLFLEIGIGGLINLELITFDFIDGDKLKPYVSKITGRDFQFGFKREFAERKFMATKKDFYGGRKMQMLSFQLERHVAYEYKRFPGKTMGEIEEGYFVVLSDKIVQLEYDELIHWCGTAKEKEARMKKQKEQQLSFDPKEFAKDDIDF